MQAIGDGLDTSAAHIMRSHHQLGHSQPSCYEVAHQVRTLSERSERTFMASEGSFGRLLTLGGERAERGVLMRF